MGVNGLLTVLPSKQNLSAYSARRDRLLYIASCLCEELLGALFPLISRGVVLAKPVSGHLRGLWMTSHVALRML